MRLSNLHSAAWLDQALRRVARVLLSVAVVALLAWCNGASAQSQCTGSRFSDGGYSIDFGYSSACSEFTAWFEGNGGGRSVTSCTSSASGGSASVMNSGGVPGATATWSMTALPLGCTDGGSTGGGTQIPGYGQCPQGAVCTALLLPVAFSLPAEDGFALGSIIVGIWAAAYFWRVTRRALNVADNDD